MSYRAGTCLAIGLLAAVPLAAQPTFRAGVDLVSVGVTVVDQQGQLVTDLTRDDFDLLEDDAPQAILHFSRSDADEELRRIRLGLLLDLSGSMERDLTLARTAAIRFLNTLPEAQDITLVDFDDEVRVARYGQADFARLVERIRQRRTGGWTAFYDALGVYLDGVDTLDGRKVLVMYTDGLDTRSALRFNEMLTLVRGANVTVYAIGLLQHQSGTSRLEGRMRLTEVTAATGGQAFFPSSLRDLGDAYARVLAEIRGQYHLGYLSSNTARDGAWRAIAVRVKRPGLRVRTREGYFAPFEAPPGSSQR